MARVEYTPLVEGLADENLADAIWAAIETETTNLEANNFAEEGLDSRALEDEVQAEQGFTPITNDTSRTQALSSTWATLEPSGGSAFRTGAITVATGEYLHLVLHIEFYSDSGQEGIPAGTDLRLRFRQSVSSSESTVGQTYQVVPGNTGGPASFFIHATVTSAASLDWAEVQISDQAGTATVQIKGASLTGTIYKKVA